MPAYPDLQGKTVLVTGGANGIGAAMVRKFAQCDAAVHFCDLDRHRGRRVTAATGAEFTHVDVTNERQLKAWVARAGRRRPISALINNAAFDPRIALSEMTVQQWDALFACNLRAYFITSREAASRMQPGAAIVNFGSITFHLGPEKMSAYVATKGGVLGFTRALARELGPCGIRVNALSPGWIMTERPLRDYVTPAVKRLIRRSQCIPKLLEPDDIADVALFLASDASRALTGQELLADRGWQFS